MNIIYKIKRFIRYLGVREDERLDVYFQKMIENKTNFNYKEIDLIKVEKRNSNNFNYFEFIYHNKKYTLIKNKLVQE